MLDERQKAAPWVIAQVKRELYAFSTISVQEMLLVPDVTRVPRSPKQVRGMINLRGGIIPLFDLRLMLNMESLTVETDALIQNLRQREQDHINWLDKLFKATEEGTHFTGELDPHKCAFGKWYDNFHTDNMLLDATLRKFDEPHKAIHGVGEKVSKLLDQGDKAAAQTLIDRTKDVELHLMLNLFEQTREILRTDTREISIVLADGSNRLSVTADCVISVETLKEDTFEDVPMKELTDGREILCGIARRVKDNAVVMLIDNDLMLGSAKQETAEAAA